MVEVAEEKMVYAVWVMYTNGEYQLVRLYDDISGAKDMVELENAALQRINKWAKERGKGESSRSKYWYTEEQMLVVKKEDKS